MAETRKPRPGERCACGQPAVVVYLKLLGAVPNCVDCRPQLLTSPVLRPRRP